MHDVMGGTNWSAWRTLCWRPAQTCAGVRGVSEGGLMGAVAARYRTTIVTVFELYEVEMMGVTELKNFE